MTDYIMKVLKWFPALMFLFLVQGIHAFPSSEDNSQDQKNKKDDQGRKQGAWIYYGKDKPNKKEYAPTDKVEEGSYKDNRKHGVWVAYYPANKLKSEIEYKYNRPNGKVVKYHENGNKSEESIWKGRYYTGAFVKYHENGEVAQKKTFNTKGKTDGLVEFYTDRGTPELIYNSSNGVNSGKLTRYYPNGDVKEEVEMNDGKANESTRVSKSRVNPKYKESVPVGKSAPQVGNLKENPGSKTNGLHKVYKKLYNTNGDLEQDGYFENGKLKDGKLYKYDKNGLLYKIEIYKNSKYFGDGVLEF